MWEYIDKMLIGLLVTLRLSFSALAFGLVLGIILALSRVYGKRSISFIASAYIELFRDTPLTVQLFIIYFGLPRFGVLFSGITAVTLALGLNSAAYQAEYLRGAIESIRRGQMDAALSIGLTRIQAIRHVILPQALRLALPSWSNEAAYLPKYSSVAFLVAVPELMSNAKIIATDTFRPMEVYLLTALIYLACITAISKSLDIVHEKYKLTID
ncbi:MAG: amino acid ABC transporter permease [Candidatus Bathyarchaeota archaeon]|nr:amino acid ABC transporter permease [Candidatus Bathyarchaeota archaeon]MDH5494162.1 amino acid ABC transporter permease [Candidatus Bathyarchaeota archaeon]